MQSPRTPTPMSPRGRSTICGYLHRIEIRSIGLITRRRYWFALSDSSPYLYWYKESDDVKSAGRICLSGAAFTYDPKEKGRFEIHAVNEVYIFECSSDKQRNEWMRVLQETRKKSWFTSHSSHSDASFDITALTRAHPSCSTPTQELLATCTSPVPPPRTKKPVNEAVEQARMSPENPPIQVEAGDEVVQIISEGMSVRSEETDSAHEAGSLSEWYLDPDGNLNDRSLEMPKRVESPEMVVKRLAEKTNDSIEAPLRAIRRNITNAFRSNKSQSIDESKKSPTASVVVPARQESSEDRCIELTDRVASLEAVVDSLRNALVAAQRQNETLKHLETIDDDDELRGYLLEKERHLTELQISCSQQARKIRTMEDETRKLEDTITDLQQSVEAFRESVRTKEELILRLCEEKAEEPTSSATSSGNVEKLLGDVEVPEAILIDVASVDCEETARRVFDEENVNDVTELKDLVDGYRDQNHFLNSEIIELHGIVQSLEEREKRLIRQNFDLEACYYQLKSRYLMVLNHFKSPEKPGKIMEPGVLRELLEESARTPRESQRSLTDQLGFYRKEKKAEDEDLLDTAASYMEKANELMEATRLEQSEEYMKWLQSWDAFLVNHSSSRQLLASSPDLKLLIRTGVPPAYRGRVWKSLVSFSVKEKQSELGNGYYACMLRKASSRKNDGVYDAAIKQIDLDLARTLPTNKHFDEPDSANIERLRNVLYSFRYHNSHVGYCQGLNRLAAIALLYLDEQDSFWFLVACVEHLQPEGYYTSSLVGAVADQKVLRDLVAEKLPKLAAHLRSLEVDLSLFALCWFLTCFVDVLPHSIYLNIFDVFLYEGNKVLFRFALALLKLCEPHVLQCKTIGTVHACLSRSSEYIPDFKSLSQVAFNELNPFPQKSIESKRSMYLAQLKDQGHG
ncbi:unnamed protein product [Caenorhabditis auriculariae]|uniref:Uncharacterized protein n=1 Tax=Caenorhabditis auriculariae TaxID=2777116 RepID=A0A8S1HTA8_9PELO|nr:unnamed protein product [Caenorhabditis auriculariae]